jgi:hypothetical protein
LDAGVTEHASIPICPVVAVRIAATHAKSIKIAPNGNVKRFSTLEGNASFAAMIAVYALWCFTTLIQNRKNMALEAIPAVPLKHCATRLTNAPYFVPIAMPRFMTVSLHCQPFYHQNNRNF